MWKVGATFKGTWFPALVMVALVAMAAVACGEGGGPVATTTATVTVTTTPMATATPTVQATASPGPTATPAPTATATPAPGAVPSLEMVTPKPGAPLPAGDLKVEVRVSNFNVVNKLGQANMPGEGHVHFFLLKPGDSVPTTPGQPAVTAAGTYHAEATTSYTWPNVQAGTYKVAVELVNNDHTPLTPPVVAEVQVRIQ